MGKIKGKYIEDDAIDEANLQLDESPTNDYILTADSAKSGGMKWAVASGGAPEGTAILSTGEAGATKYLREDGDGTCSWQTPSGSGDVVGPASAIDNAITTYDSTTGKLIKDSGLVSEGDKIYQSGYPNSYIKFNNGTIEIWSGGVKQIQW